MYTTIKNTNTNTTTPHATAELKLMDATPAVFMGLSSVIDSVDKDKMNRSEYMIH